MACEFLRASLQGKGLDSRDLGKVVTDSWKQIDFDRLAREIGDAFRRIYSAERPFPKGDAPDQSALAIEREGYGPTHLSDLWGQVIAGSTRLAAPAMMGHMDTAPHPIAAATDAIVSALNNNLLFDELSPLASQIEATLIQTFAGDFGLGEGARGLFCSGGSLANLTALLAAIGGFDGNRDIDVFFPVSAHASIEKSCRLIGIDPTGLNPVPTDAEDRVDLGAFEAALAASPPGKRRIIIGTAGTTLSGAIDPLAELGELAAAYGAWFHVDAIYGGALIFSDAMGERLRGIEMADSITTGPQKWLYVPRLSAATIFRDRKALESVTFGTSYGSTKGAHLAPGLQGSRRADAITTWVLLKVLGRDELGRLVDGAIAKGQQFHRMLDASPVLRPLHRPDLNVQLFDFRDASVDVHSVHSALTARNREWVSMVTWKERPVFRTVILHPDTDVEHFARLIASMEEIGLSK